MHRYDRADTELAGERNALQPRPPGSDSVRAVTGSGFRRSRSWHAAISVYSNEVSGACNGSRRAGRRGARQQPRAGCRCRPVACDGGRGCDAGPVPGAGGARVTRASAPGRSRCGPQGGSVRGNQDERSTGTQASGATSPGGQRSTGGACVAGTRRPRARCGGESSSACGDRTDRAEDAERGQAGGGGGFAGVRGRGR